VEVNTLSANPSNTQLTALNTLLTSLTASKTPIGCAGNGHAMLISGFVPDPSSPGNATVTILNPHGVSGPYNLTKTKSVNQNAGEFTLTLRQFAQDLEDISIPQTANNNQIDGSGSGAAPVAQPPRSAPKLSPSNVSISESFQPDAELAGLQAELNHDGTNQEQDTIAELYGLEEPLVETADADIHERLALLSEEKLAEPVPITVGSSMYLPGDAHEPALAVGEGSFLVAQDHPVQLNLELGKVNINAGTIVFVVQIGTSAAICNFSDNDQGDVAVSLTGQNPEDSIAVPMGRVLLLTVDGAQNLKGALGLQKLVAQSKLAGDRSWERRLPAGTDPDHLSNSKSYLGRFSVSRTLHNCPQLKILKHSSRKLDRELAEKMLKCGAIIAMQGYE
jgi:hypothetical protein